MGRPPGPRLDADQVDAHRRRLGILVAGEGLVVDPDVWDRLDARAGVSEVDRAIRRLCRVVFGLYSPTQPGQVSLIVAIKAQVAETAKYSAGRPLRGSWGKPGP